MVSVLKVAAAVVLSFVCGAVFTTLMFKEPVPATTAMMLSVAPVATAPVPNPVVNNPFRRKKPSPVPATAPAPAPGVPTPSLAPTVKLDNPLEGMSRMWFEKGANVDFPAGLPLYSQSGEDMELLLNFATLMGSHRKLFRGVFVELGGYNGIAFSNTKVLEDRFKWRGIMIEAQPGNYQRLKQVRQSKNCATFWSATCPAGVSSVPFIGADLVGGIPDTMTEGHKSRWHKGNPQTYNVPCKPLGNLLNEGMDNLGLVGSQRAIDFFSLDVEGAELAVLQTMNWTIPVRTWVVEVPPLPALLSSDKAMHDYKAMAALFKAHGFEKSPVSPISHCHLFPSCIPSEFWVNTKLRAQG